MSGMTLVAIGLYAALVTAPTSSELVSKIPRDPPPEELTRGLHFVRSDEFRHDLFRDRIADRGGVFVGVGTSQNYLMAGWARPERLVIIDFDEIVIHVHDAYRALFLNAKSPDEFMELWRPRASVRRKAFALINETYTSQTRRLNARKALLQFGSRVHRGLRDTARTMKEHKRPCFLDDQAQYDFVRGLFTEDRVIAIRGDFTGPKTIRGLAAVLKEVNEPISVLYLSNVEQYIGWGGRFRRNLLTLPLAEDCVVLRTYGWGRYRTADHNYRYYAQPGALFQRWLEEKKKTRYVGDFLETEEPSEIVGYHEMVIGPDGARQEFDSDS